MILLDVNEPEVTLQVYAQSPNGSRKLDVTSAVVRVYHMSGGSEVSDLLPTAMVQYGGSNLWRYNWTPVSLAADEYIAEYTLTDVNSLISVTSEDIIVRLGVQDGLTAQGYTTVRAVKLDQLDGAISGIPAAVESLQATNHGAGSWESGTLQNEFGSSMADDLTTVTFNVWMNLSGQRRTDLDSIAAKVKDGVGSEIVDLGTQIVSTADGVFKFTTPSSNLTGQISYILAITGVKGADTWYGNIGFAT
jgi:hypothetical protein